MIKPTPAPTSIDPASCIDRAEMYGRSASVMMRLAYAPDVAANYARAAAGWAMLSRPDLKREA